MSQSSNVDTLTFTASADLSDWQYRLVFVAGNGLVNKRTTEGGFCVGVLLNKPAAGEAAVVAIGGRTKVFAGANVNAGQYVKCETNGGIKSGGAFGTNHIMVGYCIKSASAGEVSEMVLNFMKL
jgi:hypothetical protein